jgi:hypothetical protein
MPGAFPPKWLSTKRHDFTGAPEDASVPPNPRFLVLSDGGVYDNMADQWAVGFRDRKRRSEKSDDWLKGEAPDELIVVNSSPRVAWSPFRRGLIPLIGELAALLRTGNILYVNTTSTRRQRLVSDKRLRTGLIQIEQSPYRVARAFHNTKALELLDAGVVSEDEWERIAEKNAKESTNLSKLGTDVATRLLYQGYVVAMCNLNSVFGDTYALFRIPDRSHFEQLAGG